MKSVRTVSLFLMLIMLIMSFSACKGESKNYEYYLTKSFFDGKILMKCRAEIKDTSNESHAESHNHSHSHIHLREDFSITDADGKEILGYDENIKDSYITGNFVAVKAETEDGKQKCALVDTDGKILIPFGDYKNIEMNSDCGFAERNDGKFVFLGKNKKPTGELFALIKNIHDSHYTARKEDGKSVFADFDKNGKLAFSGNPDENLNEANKKVITEFFKRFFDDIPKRTYTTQADSIMEFAEIMQRVDPKLGDYKPTKLPPRDFMAWIILYTDDLKKDFEIKDFYCIDLEKDGYSKGCISFSCWKYTFTLDFLLVSKGDNTFRLKEFGGSLDL